MFWTDRSTGESGYQIERKNGSGPFALIKTVNPGSNQDIDTDVSLGTTYTYRIRASGIGGPSAFTSEESASPLADSPFAKLVISPGKLNFGTVRLGTAKSKTLRFSNKGKEPVTVTLDLLAAPFEIVSGETFTLAPKQQRTLSVKFSPVSAGTVTSILKVFSTDPRALQKEVTCLGKGR